MSVKDVISLVLDAGMGATALFLVRQLTGAVKALTSAVDELKSGHHNHEGRIEALEARKAA